MRIIFFGSGEFGLPTLRTLCEKHEVAMVVSQPDRPAGRGGAITPTPIAQWAHTRTPIPVIKPENVNHPPVLEQIRSAGADAWVVIAFGQKLSRSLLADRFAINLHASLLPRWRGAAPINAAILAGDTETGNSVITLADRMDAGLILSQSRRPIDPRLIAGELHDLLAEDGPSLVLDVLDRRARNSLEPKEQDPSLVTLARKLSKADGRICWAEPAEHIRRKVHGLTPWPGVTCFFRGKPMKIHRVRVIEGERIGGFAPGQIVDAGIGEVACDAGRLLVAEVQPAGKRVMSWSDFAHGSHPRSHEKFEVDPPKID